MGFGAGMLMIAGGAILRWGVTDTVDEVNLATIGLILIVVGAIAAIASLFFWSSWGGFGSSRETGGSRTTVTERREREVV